MDTRVEDLVKIAGSLGIQVCVPFRADLLEPEERIRQLCQENKCGNYRNHYMCPPYVGSLSAIRKRLRGFRSGLLLQYGRTIDVRNDLFGVRQAKLDFHEMVLRMETHLCGEEKRDLWSMIGGDCSLCDACLVRLHQPCPYPERARTSLESIGIDVLSLLDRFGLDNSFKPDKITWTGCILY